LLKDSVVPNIADRELFIDNIILGNSVWGDFTYGGLRGVGADPNPDYAPTVSHLNFCLFQMMFAAITPALISGAILERMKFSSYVIFIFVWSTCVYDPVAHWIWSASNVTHPDDPMNVVSA
jgi:Amt family ammonium transporter